MKKQQILTIALAAVIVVLVVILVRQFTVPLGFEKEKKVREQAVIAQIKEIRSAQRAYKTKYQAYTPYFDTLIDFILHDSLEFERRVGSFDDSVAVAQGQVYMEKFKIAAIDTVFSKTFTPEMVMKLADIPYSEIYYGEPQKFYLEAAMYPTESGVEVPIFECRAPYKSFLRDLNEQELVNVIDLDIERGRYPGIKVGAMDKTTNDAGNWE